MQEHEGAQVWELIDAKGERVSVEVKARLITGDFAILLEAARRGLGRHVAAGIRLRTSDHARRA
jgi:hypothetical protein